MALPLWEHLQNREPDIHEVRIKFMDVEFDINPNFLHFKLLNYPFDQEDS